MISQSITIGHNIRRQTLPGLLEERHLEGLEGSQKDCPVLEVHNMSLFDPWYKPEWWPMRLHRCLTPEPSRWQINRKLLDHPRWSAYRMEQFQTVNRCAINTNCRVHGVRQSDKGSPDHKENRSCNRPQENPADISPRACHGIVDLSVCSSYAGIVVYSLRNPFFAKRSECSSVQFCIYADVPSYAYSVPGALKCKIGSNVVSNKHWVCTLHAVISNSIHLVSIITCIWEIQRHPYRTVMPVRHLNWTWYLKPLLVLLTGGHNGALYEFCTSD